ncbi:MAG: LPS export ABC transporter permease LptG [Burkholderiaceae bacterium]
MRTIRLLIYGEIASAVAFVTLGFLSLFFFFDFVDELQNLGKGVGGSYGLTQALSFVVLLLPSHLYELLPIAVLIGSIFVMARMAQSSEYTILRTSGMGPGRFLRVLLLLGAGFAALTFAVGDYAAPAADRQAQLLKARYLRNITIGQTGAWLKEKHAQRNFAVNIQELSPDGQLLRLRIFEFDADGLLSATIESESAKFVRGGWRLAQVQRTDFSQARRDSSAVLRSQSDEMLWPTDITSEMVAVAILKPERMGTLDLFNYIQHLNENGQTSQRYAIEFWKKVFYPLSCLVVMMLALPFAYLHLRSGSITGYVFGGVMTGISFFLLNNLFGYIGNLQNWLPWLTALAPSLIYLAFSLGAFSWLVLKR